MSILDNEFMGHIINNITEYLEGNTITIDQKETPLHSEIRNVCTVWNNLIKKKWNNKYKIMNILEEQIDHLEYTLEYGGCSGCRNLLNGWGGQNQMEHYGGCMIDDDEFEEDYVKRKNNLSVGNVKYTEYNKLESKRKRKYDDFLFA
jgi:hypothetical protein